MILCFLPQLMIPPQLLMKLNQDLQTITSWATQWKMSFNPDPNKQATEVLFSTKNNRINHPPLFFNNFTITSTNSQKHLGLIIDSKLYHHIIEN